MENGQRNLNGYIRLDMGKYKYVYIILILLLYVKQKIKNIMRSFTFHLMEIIVKRHGRVCIYAHYISHTQ